MSSVLDLMYLQYFWDIRLERYLVVWGGAGLSKELADMVTPSQA